MRVDVAVGLVAVVVTVNVDVVQAPAPPHQEPDGQQDDDEAYERLGGLLHGLGQKAVEEHERQAEQDEGRAVPQSPQKAHKTSLFDLAVVLIGGDKRRHRREVIRVARVPQTQKQAHQQQYPYAHGAVHQSFEPAVYRAHDILPVAFKRSPSPAPPARAPCREPRRSPGRRSLPRIPTSHPRHRRRDGSPRR